MKRLLLLLVSGLLVLGCTQKQVKTEPYPTDKTDNASAQKDGDALAAEKVTDDKLSLAEAQDIADKYRELASNLKDILFDYDSYDIRTDARPVLNKAAEILIENKEVNLLVEGHCDERGTNEYNLALGDRRAKSVKDYLASSGISLGRMETISYGEEKPLCSDQSEDCWAKNRRAHLVLVEDAR